MKKIFTFLPAVLFGSFATAQPCANPENIYSFSFNGHNYEVIKEMKNWETSAACAVERGGYLVQIGSQAEQDAVYDAIINGASVPYNYTSVPDGGGVAYVWIGATDKLTEGAWLWDGNNDGVGDNFWMGQGSAGAGGGYAVGGSYFFWGCTLTGTPKEPDNYGGNQHGGAMAIEGWPAGMGTLGVASEWNDLQLANQLYFVVEIENTGLNERGNEGVRIFPNPIKDSFTITSGPTDQPITSIEIISPAGKSFYRLALAASGNHLINVPGLQPGIYFAIVTQMEGATSVHRIVVAR